MSLRQALSNPLVHVCGYQGPFVLIYWEKENSTSVVEASTIKSSNKLEINSTCSVRGCEGKIVGVGKACNGIKYSYWLDHYDFRLSN